MILREWYHNNNKNNNNIIIMCVRNTLIRVWIVLQQVFTVFEIQIKMISPPNY